MSHVDGVRQIARSLDRPPFCLEGSSVFRECPLLLFQSLEVSHRMGLIEWSVKRKWIALNGCPLFSNRGYPGIDISNLLIDFSHRLVGG